MAAVEIGQRMSFEGNLCTVRFIGVVAGTTGSWLGVEWDDPSRGKHNGSHKGHRYFSCKSSSATAASFVRPTRPADQPQAFVSALQQKYAGDAGSADAPGKQIVISGKVAEEVGFEKIRRKQAQLSELKVVILDGAKVVSPYPVGGAGKEKTQTIRDTCPKVTDLELSRNLFTRLGTVVEICSELEHLRTLRINGNRFQDVVDDEGLEGAEKVFKGVKELSLEETNLEWDEICHIGSKFPSLSALAAGSNLLQSLSPIPEASFTSTLVSLNLEYNEFSSIADIASLTSIKSLRSLQLKGNKISTIEAAHQSAPAPVFPQKLRYLDLSYNNVTTWAFIDALPACFPGLTALRIAHNPLYDNPSLDDQSTSENTSTVAAGETGAAKAPTNESAYMFITARLPMLQALNFGTITSADRTDAEMFYLGRIARRLASLPQDREHEVLKSHRRWKELCEEYGEPVVVRQKEVNPNFLEARLVSVDFYILSGEREETADGETGKRLHKKHEKIERSTKIPKSFDIYAVKGIAGKLFGLPPLKLRLIWETGEWDPVAGFDEEEGDSSEDEDMETDREGQGASGPVAKEETGEERAGRWVKREVELKEGPRQFGYCVDGSEVRVRVERR
ncbi:RNI-like protein [Thozetella sp. PMI_491]|nr:RNI-like protein [Thozetella sp. PMI_491]